MVVLILFPMLISLLYLGAWLSRWSEFLTLIPNGPPMVFNTALCFLLLGLNALAFRNRRFHWFRQAWIAVFLLAGLSGLQYILSVQLGLDELITPGYLHAFRSHPGRMAPISALCLTLLSVTVGCRVNFHSQSRLLIWAVALVNSVLVSFLGLLSVIEYSFSFRESLSWGSFSKISFASALCFLTFGVACIAEIWSRIFSSDRNPRAVRALCFGLFGLTLNLIGWHFSNYQASKQVTEALQRELENRYQQFYQGFQYRAEELQRTAVPASRKQALAQDWTPPFASVRAVIRILPTPQIIWQQSTFSSESDLMGIAQGLKESHPDFAFYPSVIFQKQRLMGFLFQDRLWLFAPQVIVGSFFPSDQFSYSLKMGELVLATNTVGLIRVLQDWSVSLPMRLWEHQLTLEVIPAKSTLARITPRAPVFYLTLGFILSALLALAGWIFPWRKKV